MVHLNYAINIWLFLNNKGSHTTTRHKRRDDKERRYGSHMAGWGERSLCVKQPEPGSGACEASRERSQLNSYFPPSAPHLLSQVFAKISRWGDICLRGFWRTIERVLVVEPDERRSVTLCVYATAYSNYSLLFFTFIRLRWVAEGHQLP